MSKGAWGKEVPPHKKVRAWFTRIARTLSDLMSVAGGRPLHRKRGGGAFFAYFLSRNKKYVNLNGGILPI